MDKILILFENKLHKNVINKYGINILKNHYDIFLCDLSKYIKGKYENYTYDEKYESFEFIDIKYFCSKLKEYNFKFVLDFLAYSKKAFKLRKILEKQKLKVIKKQGASPRLDSIKNKFFISNFKCLVNYYNSKNYKHDIGISESLVSDKNFFIKKAKKRIYSHSIDYNDYLNFKGDYYKNDKKYAVFIDDMVSNHPDYNSIHKIHPPTDYDTYLNEINFFFNRFEDQTGIEIIISPHPKADEDYKEKLTSNRKCIEKKTLQLIKNCELVFTHESTAISFPVIFQKPIIYLKNNQIIKSWMSKFIDLKAQNTGSKIINISNVNDFNLNINNILSIDMNKYLIYKKNYIKHPNSKNMDTWMFLIEELKSL